MVCACPIHTFCESKTFDIAHVISSTGIDGNWDTGCDRDVYVAIGRF